MVRASLTRHIAQLDKEIARLDAAIATVTPTTDPLLAQRLRTVPGIGPVLGVTVDRTNGFVLAEGATDAITATAANGTAPYTYSWSSTLGTSYRTTNANVFTILATAPTGSYSATVTATDATMAT